VIATAGQAPRRRRRRIPSSLGGGDRPIVTFGSGITMASGSAGLAR